MPNLEARPRKGERPDRPLTWRLTWYLPPGPDGKRQRIRETFRGTKREAEARWRQRQAEIESAGRSYAPPSRQSLNEYLASWMESHVAINLKPSTARSYEQLIRLHILPHLGHVPLADLTPQMLQAWVGELARKPSRSGGALSPRTVAYVRAILRDALGEAVRLGLLPGNPLDRVRAPKQQPKVVQSFTLQEVRAIDAVASRHRLGPLFTLLWQTGLRIGEAIALRWEDVDLQGATIPVRRNYVEIGGRVVETSPKTVAGTREIALPPQAVYVLEGHRQAMAAESALRGKGWNPENLVFPSEAGTPLLRRNVHRVWERVRKEAGVPPYGLHALRHTFASLALQAGVGLREIAAHLGHENPAFTAKVYAHVLEATKRQAAERFGRLLEDE